MHIFREEFHLVSNTAGLELWKNERTDLPDDGIESSARFLARVTLVHGGTE